MARHATRNGNPGGPALTAYLGELLHYTLGDAEALSLQRFFAEARSLKLLTETPAGWPGEALTASRRSAVGGT